LRQDISGGYMRIILLGAPGVGKGTVAKILTEKTGTVQISTGDILRQAIKAGTDVGKKAEDFMKRGDLVPDGVILEIMKYRLAQSDCSNGFVLDGFPRTIPQAEALGSMLSMMNNDLEAVINIEVPREELIKRLTSRRTCSNPSCQAIYNVITSPSKDGKTCDKCGSPIVSRDDETEEAITKRLATYEEKTAPLVDYYRKEELLVTINGNQSPEKVFDEIQRSVKK
jgi:adenylate kinase